MSLEHSIAIAHVVPAACDTVAKGVDAHSLKEMYLVVAAFRAESRCRALPTRSALWWTLAR